MMALTMFNSQKINTDPMPYQCDCNPSVRSVTSYAPEGHSLTRAPRPEFDNNPNPILVAFRDAIEHSTSGATVPEIAHDLLSGAWPKFLTCDQVTHARKVLERLAALTGR